MSEFHNLAELALNRTDQSWGNLGYWKSATDYSDACRALALLLGEEAGLDPQSVVFDAGFGCGDQLPLWRDHFRVARVRGVNLSRSQTAHARAKLERAGHAAIAAAIVQGDINDPGIWRTALNREKPSHVIALDCAYHFPGRTEFSRLAHRHLARDGRLALTDFVLADQHDTASLRHQLLRWMLKCSRIAEDNIVRRDHYRLQLQEAGFDNIRMTDISPHVLPGLARFMQKLRQDKVSAGAGTYPGWLSLLKYRVTGRFLRWAYRRSILRYCVISATKTG
tara:strand:- start:39066 stop:39905 length:840 start_codon:yes stop_codon:yes gene_type:complete